MSDAKFHDLVVNLPSILLQLGTLLTVIAAFLVSLRNGHKTDAVHADVTAGNDTAARIEVQTNGVTEKLAKMTERAVTAETRNDDRENPPQ